MGRARRNRLNVVSCGLVGSDGRTDEGMKSGNNSSIEGQTTFGTLVSQIEEFVCCESGVGCAISGSEGKDVCLWFYMAVPNQKISGEIGEEAELLA